MPDFSDVPQTAYPQGYPYAPQPNKGEPYRPADFARLELGGGRGTLVAALLFYAGCGLVNFLFLPIIDQWQPEPVFLIGVVMGVFAGEIAGASIWLVWSEAAFWARLFVHWLLGYGLAICFLLGVTIAEPRDVDDVARVLFCGLPLVALAVQIPLWALRIYFGWQITGGNAQDDGPSRALSISDILSGTTVAALSVAAARFVVRNPSPLDPDVGIVWAIVVSSVAGISLISIPPAIFLILRLNRPGVGCALLLGYAIIAAVATLTVLVVLNPNSPPPSEIYVAFPVMFCTYAGMLYGVLMLARSWGLALRFAGDR